MAIENHEQVSPRSLHRGEYGGSRASAAGTQIGTFWQSRYHALCRIGAVGILAASTHVVHASALSQTSFDQLAATCAPAVSIATLQAVASVESHFQPLVIRDNSAHEMLMPTTLAAAVALAHERLERRHSLDLGLMQINAANLTLYGMPLQDAFDPCHSLTAASKILLRDFTQPTTETARQAATLIALSRYNTGRPLAGFVNGYIDQVVAVTASHQSTPSVANVSTTLPIWSVWGDPDADRAKWLVEADENYEIERAGAHSSDARNEGRAPATPSEKGEPYELSAYQESEPNKP